MSLLQIHEPGETPLPHASDRIAVGIDLGTTNSLVAVASEGRPEVIPGPDGSPLVPSVVSYGGEAGELAIVGRLARELLGHRPETVVSSIKRLMGRGIEDVKRLAGALPFHVEGESDGARGGMVRLRVAGRILSPVEISADILREMKARAEHALGRPVEQAVITVPAYFDDAARAATKDAAKLAGLDVLRLVNEPTAAALAYGLDKGAEGLYAVYDLGGGTFDVSLLRLEKGVFQVLATGGDAALGGDDFDHAIAEHLLAERGGEAAGVAAVQTALRVARDLKEALSGEERATASLTIAGRTTEHALDRGAFEALIAPLVERTVETCARVLADAGVAPAGVQGVVLVGGSTRVPLVRRRVAECFAQMPLADIDPDAVVALGAALQAEALTAGSNTLLLDVTPLSLGIETMGGLVEKVVPRNSPIPVAMAQEFTTYQDGQDAMVIHVVQGEREMVHQCRSLARFTLTGIPPMTAGAARVRVAFTVDADGLLMVSASESTTGVRQEVIVKPSYGLAEGEVERMLRESMVNARADMEERLLAGARVEAERALLALAAARAADGDLLSPIEAAAIDAAEAAVRAAMRGNDRHGIDERVEALEKCTRGFAERRMDRGVRAALAGVELGRLERALAGDA